jgi:hypothetical protein
MSKYDQLSLPQQDFAFGQKKGVHEAMMGASGIRRKISAGTKAAFHQKMSSMYSTEGTKVGGAMRLFGMSKSAMWYDRFFYDKKKADAKKTDERTIQKEEDKEDKERIKAGQNPRKVAQRRKMIRDRRAKERAEQYDELYGDKPTKADKKVGGKRSGSGGGSGGHPLDHTARQGFIDAISKNVRAVHLVVLESKEILHSLVESIGSVQQDVKDVKSLLMPRKLDVVRGRPYKGQWGQWDKRDAGRLELAHYDPLAPEGQQFVKSKKEYYGKGKTGPYRQGEAGTQPLSKGFLQSAKRQQAKATAKLVAEIVERDRQRAEGKKKREEQYKFKDEEEQAKKEDPLEEFKKDVDERLTRIEENTKKKGGLFDWISSLIGGIWGKIKDFFKNPLAILGGLAGMLPFAAMIGKAGLVGIAGYLGYQLGSWLNDKFKLDEKINDAIQSAMGWLGKGNDAAVRKSDQAAVNAKNLTLAEKNKKLAGTGYHVQEMKISEDGTTYSGGGYVDSNGNKVLEQDLPSEVKKALGIAEERTVAGSGPRNRRRVSRTSGETSWVDSTPTPSAPSAPAVGGTGTLSASSYESRLKELGDVVASGESKGDYNIFNKGTIGKNKGKIGREDLSNMTIAEYLRRGSLGQDDPQKMFAVGKYQIIPDTMRGIIKKLGLSPTNTYLTPEVQDKMFRYLVESKSAVRNYLEGKSSDQNAAILALAKEWASIGVPEDTMRNGVLVKKGDSYYSDVGGNKAHTSSERIANALQPIPTTPAGQLDNDSRTMQASTNTPATVVVSAPVQNNKTINSTNAPRSLPKAAALTDDQSFIRGSMSTHPASA